MSEFEVARKLFDANCLGVSETGAKWLSNYTPINRRKTTKLFILQFRKEVIFLCKYKLYHIIVAFSQYAIMQLHTQNHKC